MYLQRDLATRSRPGAIRSHQPPKQPLPLSAGEKCKTIAELTASGHQSAQLGQLPGDEGSEGESFWLSQFGSRLGYSVSIRGENPSPGRC